MQLLESNNKIIALQKSNAELVEEQQKLTIQKTTTDGHSKEIQKLLKNSEANYNDLRIELKSARESLAKANQKISNSS